MVPEGEFGGEALLSSVGILMLSGLMGLASVPALLGGDGNSARSTRSPSSTSDWKNSRIFVLGKRMEHL